jgi:hypothetical protein
VSYVRTSLNGDDADGRVPVSLRLQAVRFADEAQEGRLLHLLLVRGYAVSSDPGRATGMLPAFFLKRSCCQVVVLGMLESRGFGAKDVALCPCCPALALFVRFRFRQLSESSRFHNVSDRFDFFLVVRKLSRGCVDSETGARLATVTLHKRRIA